MATGRGPGPGLLLLLLGVSWAAASGPHSLRYFYTGVTEPSAGMPAFVGVGVVDGELNFVRYDSEMRRMELHVPWELGAVDPQYWDRNTRNFQGSQQVFHENLDILQKRYNQSGGYHTVQVMYGCDLLENGEIRGYDQHAYDGRDFLALDKDALTYTAADSGAVITKRKWEHEGVPERWKNYLEHTCIEWLRKYVEYGKDALERRERPHVKVSGKEIAGFLTLTCRAHGFYPRPILLTWLRDGATQDMETRRGSVTPNSDGTYYVWASIDVLPAHRAQYQCRVEHASLAEPGLYSWEPDSGLMPAVIGAVVALLLITAIIVGIVLWKKFAAKKKGSGYAVAASHDGVQDGAGAGKKLPL